MFNPFLRALGLATFLMVWEVVSVLSLVPQDFMPRLATIGDRLVHFLGSSRFYDNFQQTAQRVTLGLCVAIAISLTLAIIAGRHETFRRTMEPLADILRSLPPPALVPLLIFVLGLNPSLYYFIVIFGSMWPTYISASNALATAEPVQVNTARSFGLSDWQIMWQVRLPAAMPEIFTGVRLSAGISLLATVASEMLLGGDGLGALIYNAGFSLLWADMYALMFIIGLTGIALNLAVAAIRRPLAGWSTRYAALGNVA